MIVLFDSLAAKNRKTAYPARKNDPVSEDAKTPSNLTLLLLVRFGGSPEMTLFNKNGFKGVL
jgi:hypothetical protein